MSNEHDSNEVEGIAIVGMSGRFPGAGDVAAFWKNLEAGVDSISAFAEEDLERDAIEPSELGDPRYVKARGVLDGADLFDARFFDFSPREADITDPQQRVFLECAHQALENAGHDPRAFAGAIGVFGGAGANTYLLFNLSSRGHLVGTANTFQAIVHNKNDHLATRTAYKLDLHGPSVTVQTACSTSLVAVSLACQSLLDHHCDMALAGGVTITLPQQTGYLYHERGIGSPDGRCRPFDVNAQGTVAGNGAGVVVLRRLADALADGDTIHAVILGSALNNDGSAKVGYTAPSVDGQAEVIAMAQEIAGVDPDTIGYVEAHGTATPMGDPIEIKALTQAFRRKTERRGYCAVGSVKGNIGHLDTAAGIAGLIKTVLALEHETIPASLHYTGPNPELDLANSPFFVNDAPRAWAAGPSRRRAAVSSFGLGGTNAHVILEEAPPVATAASSRPAHLLQLSARTDTALEKLTANLVAHLESNPSIDLADVAHTLHVGRQAHAHRRIVVCRDTEDAVRALSSLVPDRVFSRVQEPVRRPVTFMFPGQGSQHAKMAAGIYASERTFRDEVDHCLALLARRQGLDLRAALFPADGGAGPRGLDQTELTQPALFVIEYALARLWMSWGVTPQSMIGHSVGEYVAACLAGVFSLEDALDLIALRGRLIQALPAGAMLSVPLPEAEVRTLLGEDLALAAVNGPSLCVVAGSAEAVDALEATLVGRELACRRLRTSHAFHSPAMDPILASFEAAVRKVERSAPAIPFVSNVTGTWIRPEEATDPGYWARHLRQTVRYGDGLGALLTEPDAVLIEVGPGRTLRTIARWHPEKKPGQFMLASLPHAEDARTDVEHLLHTVGHLWLTGIATPGLHGQERRRRIPLPTYPFERERHWIERRAGGLAPSTGSLEKRADIARWFYVPTWKESTKLLGASKAAPPATWLLLLDRVGVGSLVADWLRAAGHSVVTVGMGAAFRALGPATYEVNPARREDYDALLEDLRAKERSPDHIAHFWSLTAPGATTDDGLQRSFHSLVALAQALGAGTLAHPVELAVITNNTRAVVGGDVSCPEQAVARGACLVIPREYPDISCRNVDITLPKQGSWQEERLIEQLGLELTSRADEPVIAYRDGRRWLEAFDEVRLTEDGASPSALPFRDGGVYLITGGLGGMGLAFADHIAARTKARLVLVGRSVPPAREAWAAWLASHDEGDATSKRIRAVESLESKGAEVMICSADVTDAARIRAVVGEVRTRFGAVHGIIHAAGVAGGGMIQRRTEEAAAAVLSPKIAGTRVLEQVLGDTRLDFFVLCSSLSSIVGRFGQADYSAANAFLDAFAHAHQARTGTFTVSVNWGAWDEVGMAARPVSEARETIAKLDHPLLQRLVLDEPKRKVYATDFSVETQWIVDQHRIIGIPAVPGVTYFEMVRAALAPRAAGRTIQLEDVYFLAPFRVPEGETREARIVVEEDDAGFSFVVRGVRSDGKAVDHAVGRASFGEPRALRTLDLEAIRNRCNATRHVSSEVEHEEDLGPRWRSVKKVYPGNDEILVALEMPEAFSADFIDLKLHPALLDRASGMAKNSLGKTGFYLPLTYKSLKIHADLPRKIYSHARLSAHQETVDGETTAFDVVLMDERGTVLVEIERLTQKRVNDPGAEIRALAAREGAPAGASSSGRREEIAPAEGVAALDRILAGRASAQVVVSVRDLQATIEQTDRVLRDRVLAAADQVRSTHDGLRARGNLKTPYVAPRNDLEGKIASAWQDVLGIDRVGIDDNFFDLGGDSVQAIQIIAKANQLGLQLNPQQFFQYSTIGELSEVLGGMVSKRPEQGLVAGPVALTPWQHQLLALHAARPERASRSLVLESKRQLDGATLSRAVESLLAHHDALRLRFSMGTSGWQQSSVAPGGPSPFSQRDLAALPAVEQDTTITAAAARLQASLDLSTGPLFRAELLDLGASRGSRLVVVVHELLVDGASLPILVRDLEAAYQQLTRGEEVALGAKTASFKQWAEQLASFADSTALRNEVPFWLGDPWKQVAAIGLEPSGAPVTIEASLTLEETRTLKDTTRRAHRAELTEVLTAALARALASSAERRALLVELTGEVRDALDGLDVSRTVGPCMSAFPVRLELAPNADVGEVLRSVKEQVRRTPNRGLGHGQLRWSGRFIEAADKLGRFPPPDVSLRHLGTVDALTQDVALFADVGDALLRNPRAGLGRPLEVESLVERGRLTLRFTHGSDGSRATVERICDDTLAALRALIHRGESEVAFDAADFPLADLDADQLGALAALLDQADQPTS
jgi:phthiocerol/phenolphthiocerol synthesis type-I polyketide synthase E